MGEIIAKRTSFKKNQFLATVISLYQAKKSVTFISKQMGVSRMTVYNWLRKSMTNGAFDNTLGGAVFVEEGVDAFFRIKLSTRTPTILVPMA